jgi:2-oxoglutarate dehydrogenase E1 component
MSNLDQASFLSGANGPFIAELYSRYLADPTSVDDSWRRFFAELHDEAPAVMAELQGADWAPSQTRVIGNGHTGEINGKGLSAAATAAPQGIVEIRKATLDSVRALMLIRAYRIRGHLEAKLDPLGLEKRE